jgi:hypothetical protein
MNLHHSPLCLAGCRLLQAGCVGVTLTNLDKELLNMLHARNPENQLVPINSTKYSHKESMLDSDMLVIQHDSLLVHYGRQEKKHGQA